MKKLAIGIMSGTSLDGIDVQMAYIEGSFSHTNVKPVSFITVPFEDKMKNKVKEVISEKTLTLDQISSLNFELGEVFAKAALKLCEIEKIDIASVDFISCHGQTVWHMPKSATNLTPSTLQLGEGAIIRERCKTTVVTNFRTADIAAGGEGAPLVPFADYVLFRHAHKSRLIINIGGIANVTVLPKNCLLDDVYAFDIGPGNMMIDRIAKMFFNVDYDDLGHYANKGNIIKPLLDALLNHSFYRLSPPKSTGREMFGDQYIDNIIKPFIANDPHDIIHTITFFTARIIYDAIHMFILKKHLIDEVYLCGGGAHNQYLKDLINDLLKPIDVKILDELGYQSSAKEALAFIILGHHTLLGLPSNVKSATGAKNDVVLGQIHPYIK